MTIWGGLTRKGITGVVLGLCHCSSATMTEASPEKPSPNAAALLSEAPAPTAAVLTKGGSPQAYSRVLVRRLPFSDAALFSFVSGGATCDRHPKPGDSDFIAELLVSRFFVQDGAAPSRRPLMVRRLLVGSTLLEGPFPIKEPFIEPTTATVMFGSVEIERGSEALHGNVMAEVCLPPAVEERDQVSSEFFLSYMGARIRARGALISGSVLRISTAPLRCGDPVQGDFEVTVDTRTSAVSIDGLAVIPKSTFEGSAKANKSGNAFEVDIKGAIGGALEVRGTLTPLGCPAR